jgi:hypothetical protein
VSLAPSSYWFFWLLRTVPSDHAFAISQKNSAVTFQVAATLSKVAEAEWLRTAEGLRRFSPLIGKLGEWKAFCEGGWTGPVPGDLPDIDQKPDPPREVQEAGPDPREFGWSSSALSRSHLCLVVSWISRLVSCPVAASTSSGSFNVPESKATSGRL